jgi:hypothetical protein
MDAMKYTSPPFSLRYPQLLSLYSDEPTVPKGNVIAGNVSLGGRWLDVYDYQSFPLSVVTFRGNVVADSVVLRRRSDGESGWDPYYLDIDRRAGYVLLTRDSPQVHTLFPSTVFVPDAGLSAPFRGDYRPTQDGAAFRAGFVPPPLHRMGLVTDTFRKTLPTRTGMTTHR